MAKADVNEMGKSGPKLTPEMLEGDAAVLTLTHAERVEVDDNESKTGKRVVWAMKFEETEEHVLYLNKTQLEYMVAVYGDESDHWIGKPVAVERHTSEFGKKKFDKVWVCAPESWASIFSEAGVRAPKAVAEAAPTRRKVVKRKVKRGRKAAAK